MITTLWALALIFSELALMAVGGGNTIVPEMQRQVVEIHHWMSAQEFSALYAMAQAAPGPNMMVVPLVGWHVAGWAGLLVASLAKFGPTSLLTILVMGVWQRCKDRPWRNIVQKGLVPVTCGLVAASALIIVHSTSANWMLAAVSVLTAVVTLKGKLHPLWLLAAGAVAGILLA